jgi:Cysteine-rich CPCC
MGCSFKTDSKLYPCPCCGYLALERSGVAESCHICARQDSEEQLKDPYLTGPPNEQSLWKAQRNYLSNGNSKEGKSQQCDARKEHSRDKDWRPVIEKLDDFGSPGELEHLCVSDYSELYYWKDTFWNSQAEVYSKNPAPDVERAHCHSIFNRPQIERSATCGCFYCCAIFQAKDIKTWADQGLTPICPKCSIDSVLGSDSGYPITIEFLSSMQKRWF